MSTRRALAFSFVDRYASLLVSIVSSMMLARLLTPAEVGIFAVAMVMMALLSTVRDMGAGQYLLQEKELTADRIRAVWAVQLGVGIALGAAFATISGPAASFYDEPRIREIMLLLALNYLINPLGSVTYAWLMREMRYESIAIVRFSSTLTGAAISVFLAVRGHGAISLAWGSLGGTAANAGMSVLFRPKNYPWMPGIREVRRVLSFGTKMTSASIVSTVAVGAPEFLLGKLQSLSAAGFYSRANGLVSMFNRLVTDAVYVVALSMFSKEVRESRDSTAALMKAISYMSVLSWSFAAALIFLAHPAIRLLYGDQWDASVDATRVLAAAMVFAAPLPLCRAALVASGAVGPMLRATITSAVLSVSFAAAGAAFGLLQLAFGLLVSAALGGAIWLGSTHRVLKFDWATLRATLRKSLAVALASSVGPAATCLWFGPYPEQRVLPLAIGVIGLAAGFLIAAHAVDHPIRAEIARLLSAAKRLQRPDRRR